MRWIGRVMVWAAGVFALVACGSGNGNGRLAGQSVMAADYLRQSNVQLTLQMLYEVADRVAPLAEAQDLAQAGAIATSMQTTLLPAGFTETEHRMILDPVWNGADPDRLDLWLQYVDASGAPVREPAPGGALWIRFEGTGGAVTWGAGMLRVEYDPDRGLVIQGDLGAEFPNGSGASVTVEEFVGRQVGDLDARGAGTLALSGTAALWVHSPISGEVRGRAAFSGRTALVYLRIGSVVGDGELTFSR